jgi:hypothetical protein
MVVLSGVVSGIECPKGRHIYAQMGDTNKSAWERSQCFRFYLLRKRRVRRDMRRRKGRRLGAIESQMA